MGVFVGSLRVLDRRRAGNEYPAGSVKPLWAIVGVELATITTYHDDVGREEV